MKKNLVIVLFTSLIWSIATPVVAQVSRIQTPQVQERDGFRHRISLRLGSVAFFQYEVAVSDRFSLVFAAGGAGWEGFALAQAEIGFNYFIKGKAPRGFWFGARQGFLYYKGIGDVLGGGTALALGYTWTWNNGFTLALGLGGMVIYGKVDSVFGSKSAHVGGLPYGEFSLGYAF